jgi:hypothetical protein
MQLLGRANFLMEGENPKGKVKFLKGGEFPKGGGEFPRNFGGEIVGGGAKFLGHRKLMRARSAICYQKGIFFKKGQKQK